MAFASIGLVKKDCLGVDIGSSIIKIVQLSKTGERIRLEAYGEIKAEAIYEKPFRTIEKNTVLFQTIDIARAISGIIDEAKMTSKKAVFSIPDFSTFYTTFQLPPMSSQELPQAIKFQARQQIPLPLNEVSLDWSIIQGKPDDYQGSGIKVLLVAVPNEIISQYQEIARLVKLELYALEAEVFGFLRSVSPIKTQVAIIDIGAQSTTCSLIDRGVLKLSRSFEPAANEVIQVLSKALQIDFKEAQSLIEKYGLLPNDKPGLENTREIVLPIIDSILREVNKTIQGFSLTEGKLPELVILAGGLALTPGIKDYFAEKLGKKAEIANPFKNIFYPPILEDTLKKLSPSYIIAIGSAIRGLE
ncbi:type IV pilus assembly protein PilM [Candidatus Parcubacteria bacterium]|nr:type IV pilus assembly protein PilM [Patescibacteria group bacterium]MCG2688483.1 type IV pilus assembly protein PilM [Candidatus Parcubacteria bacterium]